MGKLKEKLNALDIAIKFRVRVKIMDEQKKYNPETLLKVNGDFYVDGKKIDFINYNELIAEGYRYGYNTLPIDELVDLVESL